jgi:hypothetical protein
VRPRRLGPGNLFTWRFKTKDYWEAVPAPGIIETTGQLMRLHEPWATSNSSDVLRVLQFHGASTTLDEEGLIVVQVEDSELAGLNQDLGRLGCRVSSEMLHNV